MEYITLSNGVQIPKVGLGISRTKNGEEAINAIKYALEAGYRHIDTAARYGNEESVGIAIRESGVPREEVFITTKVGYPTIRERGTLVSFNESLEKFGTDYVDLYLIHWPVDGWLEAWEVLEDLYEQGKIRAIGVCNCHKQHFDALYKVAKIKPMINQVESNPRFNNWKLIQDCQAQGMAMEAWSPLGGGETSMRTDETLIKIGEKYNKTPVQIIVRWNVQRNVVVIPKSANKERIFSNIDVFDFELTPEEMDIINALNQDIRSGADPDTFNR